VSSPPCSKQHDRRCGAQHRAEADHAQARATSEVLHQVRRSGSGPLEAALIKLRCCRDPASAPRAATGPRRIEKGRCPGIASQHQIEYASLRAVWAYQHGSRSPAGLSKLDVSSPIQHGSQAQQRQVPAALMATSGIGQVVYKRRRAI